MPFTANNDPFTNGDAYFEDLARHANALIPALGGECDEEMGPYYALGQVRRFFFNPSRTLEERAQILAFINQSLEMGGEATGTAIVHELFTEVYSLNEPFNSLFREYLSPPAWALFLTHRELERQRGFYRVANEGESYPYQE